MILDISEPLIRLTRYMIINQLSFRLAGFWLIVAILSLCGLIAPGRSPCPPSPPATSFGLFKPFTSFGSFGLILEIGQLPRRQLRLGIDNVFQCLPDAVVPRHLGYVED